ncbi:MAG: hypothetical protein IJ593_10715 [Lachnospiraceae bacterium]|nr:hypothetical protein [Lachnospiraceae bacterium]
MNGMTTQERINDICNRCGLSENVVRRVLDAERDSIAKSLRKGERATLIGRVVIKPELRERFEIGGTTNKYIKLSASATSSLKSLVDYTDEFDEDQGNDAGIMLTQISALN